MQKTILAVALTAFAFPLTAQGSFVSPAGLATTEGNSNNNYPWYRPFHYQQIHGDVRGMPRVIKGQAHRRDGLTPNGGAARTIDCEIWMGEGTWSGAMTSGTFASNYSATPTLVFTRKVVNAPDWSAAPGTPPAPFNLVFTYDTPFAYTGAQDLIWEVAIHATGSTNSYIADANSQGRASSPTTTLGTGCTATGQTRAMLHSASYVNDPFANQLQVTLSLSRGTATSPGVFLMGTKNPMLPLPGFCGSSSTLFTDGQLQIPGTTSSSGSMSTGAMPVRWNPFFVGAQLYTQAATIDTGLPGGLAIANGRSVTIASMPVGGQYARIYALSQPTATSGSVGLGFAIVTEFRL